RAASGPPRRRRPRPLRGREHRARSPAAVTTERRRRPAYRRRDLRHRNQPHHADGRRARRAFARGDTVQHRQSGGLAMTDTAEAKTSPTTTREAVLAAAKKMLEDGLVEGTSGNISGRLEGGLVCMTPSSVPYDTMTLEDLVV